MEQFNLESYLANPNQRVVTRDGREVRILCTDIKNRNYSIAYIWKSNNGVEFVGTCAKNGRNYSEDVNDYELDLFFVPITERVKTLEDAVKILGEDHSFVKQLDAVTDTILADEYGIDVIAYLKLRIITVALNEGWEPRFTEDEYRYYPWFALCTQEEWNGLDEEIKRERVLFGGDDYRVNVGFMCVDSIGAPLGANATLGSRLCFRTDELARYAGRQFAYLYADFYLIRK